MGSSRPAPRPASQSCSTRRLVLTGWSRAGLDGPGPFPSQTSRISHPGPDAALTAQQQQQQQQQRSKVERCRPLGAGHTEPRSTQGALYSEPGHHALGEMARRGGGAELARAGAPISPARAAGSRAASSEGLARRRPRGGRAAGGVTAAPAPRSAWSALAHSLFQIGLRGWTAPPVPHELGSTSHPGLAQVSQHQPRDSSRSLLLVPEGWGPAVVPDLGKNEAVGSPRGLRCLGF